MITAIDTSVLSDIFTGDRMFAELSAQALAISLALGRVVACDVVWAETRSLFNDGAVAADALRRAGVEFDPLTSAAALAAGAAWARYRRAGGARDRRIPDFLIGGHAEARAARLLTRDAGFRRQYFEGLVVVEPRDLAPGQP